MSFAARFDDTSTLAPGTLGDYTSDELVYLVHTLSKRATHYGANESAGALRDFEQAQVYLNMLEAALKKVEIKTFSELLKPTTTDILYTANIFGNTLFIDKNADGNPEVQLNGNPIFSDEQLTSGFMELRARLEAYKELALANNPKLAPMLKLGEKPPPYQRRVIQKNPTEGVTFL